jgi:hypothetical protein
MVVVSSSVVWSEVDREELVSGALVVLVGDSWVDE